MNQEEVMNLNINAGILMSGGMLISFASAFGGIAVDFTSIFKTITTSANADDFDDNINAFVAEIEDDVLSQLLPQVDELRRTLPESYSASFESLSNDDDFFKGESLLAAVIAATPQHLSPLTHALTKEEISQYLALMMAEGDFAKEFVNLAEWMKAIDPEEKKQRKLAEQKSKHFADFLIAIEKGDLDKVESLHKDFAFEFNESFGDNDEVPLHIALFKAPAEKFEAIYQLANIDNVRQLDKLLSKLIDEAQDKTREQVVHYLLNEMLTLEDGEEQFGKRLTNQLESADEIWVDWMLSIKPDFSFEQDGYGNSYLTAAISSGNVKLVSLLFDKNLPVDTEVTFRNELDSNYLTNVAAFHMACLLGHWDIFDELVRRGAELNKTNLWRTLDEGPYYIGLTYLGKLLEKPEPYTEDELIAIRHLVDAGALVAQHDMESLRRVAGIYADHTGKDQQAALADLGFDSTQDEHLVEAVQRTDLAAIEELMTKHGANATSEDSILNRPALFVAIDKGNESVLKKLIENSPLLRDEDQSAWRKAMDYAIDQKNLAGFKAWLTVAGDNKFEVLTTGSLVGKFAQKNQPEWLEAFLDYSQSLGISFGMAMDERESEGRAVPVIESIRQGDVKLLSLVMRMGGYQDSYDINGQSAMQLCLEQSRYDLALALYPQIEIQQEDQAEALYELAMMFYNGRGVTQDFHIAESLFLQATDQGHIESWVRLGYLYEHGLPGDADAEKAFDCYHRAAKAGSAVGMNSLGIAYMNGRGVSGNECEGNRWYLDAAKQGLAGSQENIGYSYLVGRGIDVDLSKAAYWYEKAANQGSDTAQNTIGNLYYNGEGVEKDESKAFYWYQLAAEQGLSSGQFNMGKMYKYGAGCEQSNEDSYQWYLKAAEQGLAAAQHEVGHVFDNGVVVTRDVQEATKWFQLAADQGYEKSQALLNNYP